MKKDTLVRSLTLEYPDCFEKMERAELEKHYSTAENRWGIIDRGQHMVISLGWTKKLGTLGSLLVDEKSFLKTIDKRLGRVLKEYRRTEDISKRLFGSSVRGFGFCYTASDKPVAMTGKIIAFRAGKRIFGAEYMTSNTDTLFCNMAYDMVLNSIRNAPD